MKKQSIDWNGTSITVTYGNGQKFVGDTSKLPASVWLDCPAARHGLTQKLGDAKSGGTASEKFAEVKEIWASLLTGSWNRRAATDTSELILRAYHILAHKAGVKAEQADDWFQQYQGMTEERQAEVRNKAFMKAALEAAKAEKRLVAAGTVDTDTPFNPNE